MSPTKPSIKEILASADMADRAGDSARAIAIYSKILASFPKHSKAKKALNRLRKISGGGQNRMTQMDANQIGDLLNQGAFAQVLELVNLLLVHNRKEPFLYNIQGLAQTHLDQQKQAINSFKHAIKLNPNLVEAYNNLGMVLIKDNRAEEALVPLQKAIAKRENYPEAHHNLGVALATLDRNDQALAAYGRAIALRPNYANAFNSRGSLHHQMNTPRAAIADFERALQLLPDDAEVCGNLSGVYADIGNPDQALAWAAKAADLQPETVKYLYSHAVSLNEKGLTERTIDLLDKVLRIDPDHAPSLGLRVSMRDGVKDEIYVQRTKDLLAKSTTDAADKVLLGFALAKLSEEMGDYQLGFDYLSEANRLNFALLDYDPAKEDAEFAQLKQVFSPEIAGRLKGTGNSSDVPILIVGLMRSGTSLVEQILASHSQVWGAGELQSATRRMAELDLGQGAPNAEQVKAFADAYLDDLTLYSAGARHVTDKMPINFKVIGLLKLAFPNIKIINMVRDPRDNCYSIYKNFFDTQAHQYAYDLEHLANFANQYKSLMAHWHSVFPGQIYDCHYEALTANQEDESRKLLAYCGLEWEAGVLDFHQNKRAVRTASVHQVRKKIYQTSVRSWARVSDRLAPLIDKLDKDLWAEYLTDKS